jgi:hypothetical protein
LCEAFLKATEFATDFGTHDSLVIIGADKDLQQALAVHGGLARERQL